MLNLYETLLSKQEKWVSLGDLFNENNEINMHFNNFIRMFSEDEKIYVNIFQYGIFSEINEKNINANNLQFLSFGLVDDIPQYLNNDGSITYNVADNKHVEKEYPKLQKRKDFILGIHIVNRRVNISFLNISHIDHKILAGFKIFCTCKSEGKEKRNIDLVEYWDNSKFKFDDQITIDNQIIPKAFFDEG